MDSTQWGSLAVQLAGLGISRSTIDECFGHAQRSWEREENKRKELEAFQGKRQPSQELIKEYMEYKKAYEEDQRLAREKVERTHALIQTSQSMSEQERVLLIVDKILPILEERYKERISLNNRLMELVERFNRDGFFSDELARLGINLPPISQVLEEGTKLIEPTKGLCSLGCFG